MPTHLSTDLPSDLPTNLLAAVAQGPTATAPAGTPGVDDVLIEDVSIDGMCGVY